MLSPERLDRIHVAFDDRRLVANAGLILPVTLAHHLGLGELVDRHVDPADPLKRPYPAKLRARHQRRSPALHGQHQRLPQPGPVPENVHPIR